MRDDQPYRGIQVVEHIARGDAYHAVSVLNDESVTRLIARRAARAIMRFAIDFDYQPRRGTIEVDDIGADRVLFSKPRTGFAAFQLLP